MRDRLLAARRVGTLAGIYVLLLLVARGVVGAQESRALDRDEAALATALAKLAANEASLARVIPADIALIHQVTEAHGSTARERLAWLRSHSPCVLGSLSDDEARARPGACLWTRHLTDSDREPRHWRERNAQPWSRYVERWRQVRIVARRLVSGVLVMRPCDGVPVTWGSVALDTDGARARGLVPLRCRDPQTGERLRNDGFVRASGGLS